MSTLTNPLEIARETLRLLATRKIPPTPDNYRVIYDEIAGVTPTAPFPEKQLRALAAALPKASPDQLRLGRELDMAIKQQDWDDYKNKLVGYVEGLVSEARPQWADLIRGLLQQMDLRHVEFTQAKKRESLEHVLESAAANPEVLYSRLNNLVFSWSRSPSTRAEGGPAEAAALVEAVGAGAPGAGNYAVIQELRQTMSFFLKSPLAPIAQERPELAKRINALEEELHACTTPESLQNFRDKLQELSSEVEIYSEDQQEFRSSLLNLLRLLVSNASELVVEDNWLHGQIDIVRDIIDKPLSQRTIEEAERCLKEVIFKQSKLKSGLNEAKDALKNMLSGFVDRLANLADTTSDYNEKIGVCAQQIDAAEDISQLQDVIGVVMQETQSMQVQAQRSHDELQAARRRVEETEKRITELQQELDQASYLARHDQLTGALNRRGLEEMFEKEAARAQRHKRPMCIALLDIDNFKKLNDNLGHDVGDAALIHLASVIRESMRPQDSAARYGGEEFIILLPETELEEGSQAVTRLQRELTKEIFLHEHKQTLITFSAGITQYRAGESLNTIAKRADEGMYQAKQAGKNRVIAV